MVTNFVQLLREVLLATVAGQETTAVVLTETTLHKELLIRYGNTKKVKREP